MSQINEIFNLRVGKGYIRDFGEIVAEAYDSDRSISEVAREFIVQRGIDRYADKITAALRRGGVDIDDDVQLTEDKLRDIVAEQMGIAKDKLDNLSEEVILGEIDRQISEKLSAELGFEIESVFNGDALAQALQQGIDAKIEQLEGNIEKYLDAATIRNLRRKATWARSGLDARTVQNCLAQRSWRQSNKWIYF